MIKNLRSIFVVALMAVSGSMFAQGTTESKGEVINFVNFYKPLTEVKEVEAGKDKIFYIATKAIEQNGIKVTFDKVNGSGAPTYTIAWDKNKNEYVAHNFIRLYGGDVKKAFLDGNTMVFESDKNITKISLAASNANYWATIKADCGKIEMTGADPNAKPARPAIDAVWTNVNEKGATIDTKKVVFTIYRDEASTVNQAVRYGSATVFTADGAATGINNITAAKAQNGVRYNLAGQRVSKDFKGVVIENGKKMIVK
ncbi:hypothetical protein [Prevotella sp.]|uniref:hypothetical protein n=1 Tax=Prevotella sp. TaxID=59823 RepID=UPI003076F8B0